MKPATFKRCPIHGTRLKGGPNVYRCPRDSGHTPRLPDLDTDVIDWPAICDGCGKKRSVAQISDWLCSDARLDVHYCPGCEHRIARQLIEDARGPAWRRFLAALWRLM